MKSDTWTGEVRILQITAAAILVEETAESNDKKDCFWLPKSQLKDLEAYDFTKGEEIEVEIPRWLAEEKGLV